MSEVREVKKQSGRPLWQWIILYCLVIAIAVVGGYYLSARLIPTPKVGLVSVEAPIGSLVNEIIYRELAYARKAPDIKAVVLVINSPGGSAAAGHDIYYQVRQLREEKPVVASMETLAASAAYQIGVGANEIYAKPASIVGNVGVIFQQPSPEMLSEQFLTSGPFKTTGGSGTSFVQKLDLLHADFRDSVVAERSKAPNPLKLTGEQVATGEIWVGIEAKELGIIDELGSRMEAIERAAQLANLRNYEVVNVRDEYLAFLRDSNDYESTLALYAELDSQQIEFDLSAEGTEWPSFYQLYIPLE